MSINRTMVSLVNQFQADGSDVWVGRVGVSELIAVQQATLDQSSDVVTITLQSTGPAEYLYIAPDQLAVVQFRAR